MHGIKTELPKNRYFSCIGRDRECKCDSSAALGRLEYTNTTSAFEWVKKNDDRTPMCFCSPVEIPCLCAATLPAASASVPPVSYSVPPPAGVRQVGRLEDLGRKGGHEEDLRGSKEQTKRRIERMKSVRG